MSPYDQAKKSIEALPAADQMRLISELTGRLSGQFERQPQRSLLELRGLVRRSGKASMRRNTCARNAHRGVDRLAAWFDRRSGYGPLIYYIGKPNFLAKVAPFLEASPWSGHWQLWACGCSGSTV